MLKTALSGQARTLNAPNARLSNPAHDSLLPHCHNLLRQPSPVKQPLCPNNQALSGNPLPKQPSRVKQPLCPNNNALLSNPSAQTTRPSSANPTTRPCSATSPPPSANPSAPNGSARFSRAGRGRPKLPRLHSRSSMGSSAAGSAKAASADRGCDERAPSGTPLGARAVALGSDTPRAAPNSADVLIAHKICKPKCTEHNTSAH